MSTEARVLALEKRVAALESERPGRKARPILVSAEGVCGVDPDSDSEVCPFASLYRRNKGCQGTACKRLASAYYKSRHIAKKAQAS